MNTMSNPVEKYILEGICNGCDQCPICCHNQGYCEYDGPENTEEVNNDVKQRNQ